MALHLYLRVSTDQQDYAQQRATIDRHLSAINIKLSDIHEEVVEKISGLVNHKDRKLAQLLKRCKSGDTVFISELSRLGRNMSDLYSIVNECCDRGIIIVQCEDGQQIENKTIGGKALLFALSLAAEIEVSNLHQRVRSGVSVALNELKTSGHRMTRKGTIQTHWGNAKGCDMSAATEASCRAKQDAAILWREASQAVKFARRKRAEGWGIIQIAEELGKLFDENATEQAVNPYATSTGCKPSKGTVSKWLREMNPLAV